MLYRAFAAAVLWLLAFSVPAHAGPYTDNLGKCMNEGLTDQDRMLFAKWMVVLLAAHPELKPMITISNDQRIDIHHGMADLFVRLMSETCRQEVTEAVKFEGPAALQSAGQMFGQFAMQGFIGNPEVMQEASVFGGMVDESKMSFLKDLVQQR